MSASLKTAINVSAGISPEFCTAKMPSTPLFLPHFQQQFPIFQYKCRYLISPDNGILQICQCNDFSAVWKVPLWFLFGSQDATERKPLEKGAMSLWESTFPIFLLLYNFFANSLENPLLHYFKKGYKVRAGKFKFLLLINKYKNQNLNRNIIVYLIISKS